MDSSQTTKAQSNDKQFSQNVIVMRHGDRADNFEPLWVSTAARPWDPHIVEEGRVRAFCTGRRLRANLGFPIDRVFVSPFLRCIQTAYEVVSALCSVDDDPTVMSSDAVVSLDPSKVKVRSSLHVHNISLLDIHVSLSLSLSLCLCDYRHSICILKMNITMLFFRSPLSMDYARC